MKKGKPKSNAVRLAEVVPTAEEIAAARQLIESAADPKKEEKKRMATFTYWLKTHADADGCDASAMEESRGEQRR